MKASVTDVYAAKSYIQLAIDPLEAHLEQARTALLLHTSFHCVRMHTDMILGCHNLLQDSQVPVVNRS